jgi:hypothetical protein
VRCEVAHYGEHGLGVMVRREPELGGHLAAFFQAGDQRAQPVERGARPEEAQAAGGSRRLLDARRSCLGAEIDPVR